MLTRIPRTSSGTKEKPSTERPISSPGDGIVANREADEQFQNLATLSGQSSSDQSIGSLQRQADEYTSRRSNLVIQPKMKVGAANDPMETEADKVASAVVKSMNSNTEALSSGISRKTALPIAQRRVGLEQEEERIGKEGGEVSRNVESTIQQAKGNGSSLDASLQRDMGNALGADFSSVKVHNDNESDALNKAVGARAFTTGNDIFFKRGEYDPSSPGGQELIAHELAHVVQQAGPSIKAKHIQRDDAAGEQEEEDEIDLSGDDDIVPEFSEDAEVETEELSGNLGEKRSVTDGANLELQDRTVTKGGNVVSTKKGRATQALNEYGAAVQRIKDMDGASIKEATRLLARAGAFGEVKAQQTLETAGGTKASAEGSASGFVGAELEAVSGTVIDAIEGLTHFAKIAAKVGVGADIAGQAKLAKKVGGVALEALIKGKLSGFAGAMVEAGGKINFNATGMAMQGQAYAFAGAKAEGEVSATLKVGELGLEAGASFEAMAGAEAEAAGKISLGYDGVEATGKAGCFAGTRVKAEAASSLSYQGRVFLKISGGIEASAGVGAEVEGTFSLKKGKLVIGGRLAGSLGLGGGFSGQVEVDFGVIADMIGNKIRNFLNKPPEVRKEPLSKAEKATAKPETEEKQNEVKARLRKEVLPYLQQYGKKKEELFKRGGWFGSKNLVKKDGIQAILNEHVLGGKFDLKQAYIDTELMKLCHEAFGHQYVKLSINSGIVEEFEGKTSL